MSINKCIYSGGLETPSLKQFHQPLKLSFLLLLPSPQFLATTDLLFTLRLSFSFSEMSYEWSHTVYNLLFLVFAIMLLRSIHILSCISSS